MLSFNGPRPEHLRRPSRRHRPAPGRRNQLATARFAGLLSGIALVNVALATTPLTLSEAERLALTDEPGLHALEARTVTLDARALAADALPAPVLRVGLNNYPIESGDFSTEGMTNAGLTWRQAFPPGDVRALSRERLDWESAATRRQGQARVREVRLRVRETWLNAFLGQHSETLLDASRPLFRDLLEVTRSLYAVGRKNQQDVLRAELELGRLEDRLIEAQRLQARSRAELARWTGVTDRRPFPEALPGLPPIPDVQALTAALTHHPLLMASDARLEAQGKAVALADEQRRPGWALDLGYAYREGNLSSGEPRSDFFTVGVSFDLPVLRRRALDSSLQAALAEEDAVEFEREALRRTLEGELGVQHAQWIDLGRRIELYESGILRQAAAHAEAAKLAYQADTADFADVMRAAIDELDAKLEHLRLQVERARGQAALAYLGGLDHES